MLYAGNGSPVGTYTTDEFGRYEIPNVAAGTGYRLEVETPDGCRMTPIVAANDVDGSKFLASAQTDPFDVVVDEAYRYNVGLVPLPRSSTSH